MYSQYNQYQQPAAVTTTQPGLFWNGTAWVPHHSSTDGAGATTTTTHSSYASAVTSTNTNNISNPALSERYTQYYHLWKAQETEQLKLAQSLAGTAGQGEEASRQAQWAKHYSDLSSIAAHYYHNHAPQTPVPTLPPAPPGATAETGTAAVTQNTVTQTAAPQHDDTPDGLKRFVHKCLQQCRSQEEKQQMQKRIEDVIADAIRSGTMHTTHWDSKPLLSVAPTQDTATLVQQSGGTAAAIKKFRQRNGQGVAATSHYDYGPSSTRGASDGGTSYAYGPSSSSGGGTGATGGGADYYGLSASTPLSKSGDSHYGPSSSNSSYYGPSSLSSSQPTLATAASSSADYYGPSPPPSTIATDSHDKYKSKWKLQDKFPATSTPSDFVSSDNYYGPSKDLGDDDFVSLSSHKISRKRKKKEKTSSKSVKVKKQVILASPKGGFERSSSTLAKRANRFSGAGGIAEAASLSPSTKKNGMERFMGLALIGGSKKLEEADYEHMKVKGTCTALEKEYLRLTAPPRAELVRPEAILSKHLENLKKEWFSPRHRDYIWFCSQLKAVRQDLTVQQISNSFAVTVYETHARIALEEGDLNEYNQCQTQLKELYKTLHADTEATKNQNEFIAYRLIYYVILQGNKKYEGGSSDLFNIMLLLTPEQRKDSHISHALKVRVAVAEYDYHAFFRLFTQSSRHDKFLMNYMIPKVRHWALQRFCKAYRPTVPTKHVLKELGFDVDKELDFGKKWLASCGVLLSENGDAVLAKDSVVRESDLTEKESSLI